MFFVFCHNSFALSQMVKICIMIKNYFFKILSSLKHTFSDYKSHKNSLNSYFTEIYTVQTLSPINPQRCYCKHIAQMCLLCTKSFTYVYIQLKCNHTIHSSSTFVDQGEIVSCRRYICAYICNAAFNT